MILAQFMSDVAQAQIGRKFQDSVFLLNGNPSAAIGVIRRGGECTRRIPRCTGNSSYRNSSIKKDRVYFEIPMTRAAILTSQCLLCSGSDYWGGNHRVATIFRFAADGSCDRNQHPHLNDRRVCRVIIIATINIISLAALGSLRVWWWTTRLW